MLSDVWQSVPFHVTTPSYRCGDGSAEVIVQQVGPGLFDGETLDLEIVVEPDARLVVKGQSATKLYPCPIGIGARVRTILRVEKGGELIYVPGELIPFRDAVYRQETEIHLAPDAHMILSEIVTPGRIAMGERDAYDRLELRLRVWTGGRLILAERNLLEPKLRPLRVVGRHGDFACAGSCYVFGYDHGGEAERRQDSRDLPVSPPPRPTVYRLLANTPQEIRAAIEAHLLTVVGFNLLGDGLRDGFAPRARRKG